ncbi:hypothetical protein, partial [Desulfofundulus luciae]|uniref:hypothetical protein n=1 Tax=Desulfofundulus luciae TaxID=74702 RepID=UPI0027D83A3F
IGKTVEVDHFYFIIGGSLSHYQVDQFYIDKRMYCPDNGLLPLHRRSCSNSSLNFSAPYNSNEARNPVKSRVLVGGIPKNCGSVVPRLQIFGFSNLP